MDFKLFLVLGVFSVAVTFAADDVEILKPVTCSTEGSITKCCTSINIPDNANKPACISFHANNEETVFSAATFDGHNIGNFTIHKRDMDKRSVGPFCVYVPLTFETVQLCLAITQIHLENDYIRICTKLEVRLGELGTKVVAIPCLRIKISQE